MVYGGTLNIDILSSFRAHHTPAVGVSGVDAGLVTAHRRPKRMVEPAPGQAAVEVDFGFVGDIDNVDPKVLLTLLDAGMTPVVSCLGADTEGNIFNINADSIAESIARALKAEKLVIVTDTEGLLKDVGDPSSLVSYTDLEEVEAFKKAGRLTGGMLPKIDACARALQGGVRRTHIINGLKPGALLRETFTNAGCGTMIVEAERQNTRPSSWPRSRRRMNAVDLREVIAIVESRQEDAVVAHLHSAMLSWAFPRKSPAEPDDHARRRRRSSS